ncbi:hypothetical protein FI667_g3024, partial [Globisporangium splendens]
MKQPREEAAKKGASEGVSTKTAVTLRSGRAQADAVVAVRASQHKKGGAPDPKRTNEREQVNAGAPDKSGTIEEGTTDPSGGNDAMTGRHETTPSPAEGSPKKASTETAPMERYETLAAKLRVSPNAVSRVEIEYEVRLMFAALYNGMRILKKPKKANDNYPTLNGEEADALVDLFRLLAIEMEKSFPEWKRTIQDLCKDMHRSSWTVVALIQKRIDLNRLGPESEASPWSSQTSTNSQTNVKEQGTQPFTFKSSKYSEEEQRNMIRHCQQKFEYSVTLRQPTTMEWEIMLAIVEGELLIRYLPQFLRRVCDGDTLFRFQNTIAAQVEGELVGKLSKSTQVYKDHQSTGRIVEAILRAARYRKDGRMEETMAMLKDLKAADDEMGQNDDPLPTPIGAAQIRAPNGDNRRSIGDKQRLEQTIESGWAIERRIEIHVQNVAFEHSSLNENGLVFRILEADDTQAILHHPLDEYRLRSNHSQLWEVLFEEELCPKALIDINRMIWRGRTIVLHHASKHRMAPCLICGAAGHFARACKAAEQELTTNSCIHADDEIPTTQLQPKNASSAVGTGISVQQTGKLKEQATAKPNGGAANAKGPVPKASQKNVSRQISKDDIRWVKQLMRFRRDMDELMKVHVERQAELNSNRNDIMGWDGEYTLQDTMDANGLAEATTSPTGNCQFYAVVEVMLQFTHDDRANEKLLEATASGIKQSINAVARFNFDLEFPEGTHLGILEAPGRGDRKMSPRERKADILSYFNDIASSSFSRSSTLPGSLRGGLESLRMAAKALQRKIFVLIETIYGDRKGYGVYKPRSRVHVGGQFLSAKEHARAGKQWEDELRQDRIEAEATNSPLPIVMEFANEHYNSLHFRAPNDLSSPANMTGTSLAKHLQGSERSKTEFKTDRSGQFDFEPVPEDPVEDSDNSSLGGLVWTPPLDEREKFEPNQLSGQHGWSFASQENQLVPQCPLKKTKMHSRRLAIKGDSMQKRRDLERTPQEQWKQETKCPFPLLSSNHDVWTQAALNEWERMLAMLKASPGPHHVLNHLRGPTLVDLTQVLRKQVVEEGLKRLSYRTDQAETRGWITGWFDRIATATTKQQRAALLNSKEDWLTLGEMKYGVLDALRLCYPTQQEKLSRYIICIVVYEEELQAFRSSDAEDPNNLYEAIEDFCAMLKQTRELKAAFKNGEELSEWSALSVIVTQITMEVDSVEPSRKVSKWTNRTVAIKSKGVAWINVYAPNKKSEREHFFRRLNEESGTHRAAAVLGGDFNCVLDNAEPRRLVAEWNICDAWELVESPEWPVQREPTEHFTYWRKNSASRLDRFHIAGNLGSAVQWETIELPKRYSDHQAVVLHIKWTSQPQRPRKVDKCRYPIRTSRSDLVRAGVQKAVAHELELIQSEGSIEWSHLEKRITKAILRVSRVEKRQVRRYRQKLEDQQHRPASRSRRQLIEEQANAARGAAEFKIGKYMQATQGDVRHFFRKIANWQRHQTISRLEPTPGRYHPPNASLADIMGTEWHQITGQTHAVVPPHKTEQRFDSLMYIPETRKVTEAQSQDLMAPITEKEVREAIADLHRHMAGGVDSLNNHTYKDCETIHQLSEETRVFWPSFQWNDNPWILDSQGEQRTAKTGLFLKGCNLASFNVRREEERVFSVRLPTTTSTLTFKRMTTLRKLAASIILCSPEIEIDAGNRPISQQEPWSRKHTKREYKWISNGMQTEFSGQ